MTHVEASRAIAPKRSGGIDLALALGVSLAATLVFALDVREHAHFASDDYIAFHDALTEPLWNYLLTPIDIHFLPLHKLASHLIYQIAPLDFDFALGVLCSFHLLGLWMLYRTLELIQPSRLNAPLTALCGTNFYLVALLVWWTAGIARLPCIFLSLAAIYHYLKFRKTGSPWRLSAILLCQVGASAFFSKGMLIPGFLGALELAFLPETPRRALARNLAAVVLTASVAVAYYLLSSHMISDAFESPPFRWQDQVAAFRIPWPILQQGVFGLLASVPLSVGNWLVVGLWSVFFVASVLRARFNAVVWLIAFVTLAVNFLIITLSPRMRLGTLVFTWERYYFDLMFLVVLFIAILLKRTLPGALESNSRLARSGVAVTWLGVLVTAWLSQQSAPLVLDSPRHKDLPFIRTYANNLKADLLEIRRTHAGTLNFEEGRVPPPLMGMSWWNMNAYSDFLPLFDPEIHVLPRGKCLYVVKHDGSIARPPKRCGSPPLGRRRRNG